MSSPPAGLSRRRWAGAAALASLVLVATAGASESAGAAASAGASASPAPAGSASVSAQVARRRPDIVVIMADDMREDDLRWMPKARRLIGARGVRFANAFSPYPLCCPARASFLTGQYTHNHGVWSHKRPWAFPALRDRSTLPVWLRRSGYQTGFVGKYLNGYGRLRRRDGSRSTRYVPPGWTQWRASIDGGLSSRHPLHGGTYHYFDTTLNVNGELVGNEGDYQTGVLGDQTDLVLRRLSRTARPFFVWANYVAPHGGGPRESDDPVRVLGSDGAIRRFATPARPRWVRGRFDRRILHAPGESGEADVSDKRWWIGRLLPVNRAERAALLEVTRQRAEALSVLDSQIARTIRTLDRLGRLSRTLVVLTSDNGYFLGEHRLRHGKVLPYEPALAIPLLVRGPGIPAGEVRRDPFAMIDFAPTFLAAAGIAPRASVDGASMLAVARHGDRGWRRPVLTTDLESLGIRTRDYLFVRNRSGRRELYDMARDPGQLESVAGEDEYATPLSELADVLERMSDCAGKACRAGLPPSFLTRGRFRRGG